MVVSVSIEKRKAEMKPLTLLTHGVQLSSPRWSRSPLKKKKNRREIEEDKDGEKKREAGLLSVVSVKVVGVRVRG